jgi:hypothetical protein
MRLRIFSRAVAKSTNEIVAEGDHPCMPRWVDPAALEQAQKFALQPLPKGSQGPFYSPKDKA